MYDTLSYRNPLSARQMIVHRISGQKRKTLFEFYGKRYETHSRPTRVALDGMCALLRHLETIDGPELFVFTSHYHLCFVDGDSHTYPLIARVAPGCTAEDDGPLAALYHIGYPPTPDVARKDTEWVHHTAGDITRAGELLLDALRKSAFSPMA
ncbi:hypothetical protein [Rhodopirellula sp. P2]|uniref:hypothetical protein n=1 Tax=Rhodopirellula sp. P2 TaxID=2127060 RepID=UPI002368A3E1|nr:hypothetical protein [Rhodopirellula sp. P2]WDQ19130.1 hypothetical protein PSR62_11445 [Rhodopirellula sp. P2]